MVEIVISIAAKVAEYLVDPILQPICYAFKYQRNMEELKRQVRKLTNERECVQLSVDDAKIQGVVILKHVQEWLESVDEFAEKVAKPIIDDQVKVKKLCSIGFCPSLMTRYSLSKKAVKTVKDGVDLLEEGKFQKVSCRPPPQRANSLIIKGYEDFASRKSLSESIMEALADADTNLIGVYGMGGVGKTTLVKKVAQQAKENKLFDVVVTAVLTEKPDIRKIQGQIADELGLKFQEESLPGRAARLRERMKKENRILIILDNVWAELDLESIGIPSGSDEKGSIMRKVNQEEGENANKRRCKILLTSRRLDVLRDNMDIQKNFKVEILSDPEGESLFWKTVGYSEEKSDLNPTAVEIVGKCAGLPVAIKTIAKALKNKGLPVWKNALDQLKKANPKDIKGMNADVYSTIELSLNLLENEEAKSLFLFCSLCNGGYGVDITDLLKYSMGLSLFQDFYTLEEGRNKLHTLIDYLKTSCLLMDDDSDRVKMHDIIHAVAVSISSTTKLWFNIQDAAGLKEALGKKLTKESAAVSLLYRDIYELPEKMEFPKLEQFLLRMEDASLQIPDAVFEGMKGLKVLDMSGIHLLSPPSSLRCIINLHTLCLDRCQLEDVAIIGELKELEILSFLLSDIELLPREIGQLTRLRLLDLSYCSRLKVIKPNVISSLTRLEELYMGNSFDQWDIDGQRNASLAELKQLSNLTALDIHVPNARIIPQGLSFEKLERYRIFVGEVWDWSSKCETSRTLKLKLSSSIYSSNEIKSLLNRTEDIHLDKLKGVKSVVYELSGEGFPQLKHLHVQNGFDIQYIANSFGWGPCNVFPRLESLFLDNLINLEKICHAQLTPMSFGKLRIMKVRKCDRLKHLFSFSMVNNLSQLQEIEVTNCKKLKEIISKESMELVHQNESIRRIGFTQLHTLTLKCLPQLTSFSFNASTPVIGSKEIVAEDEADGFTSLFSQNVVLPSLKNLKLSSINIRCTWLDQLPVISSCCQALTDLTLEECNDLKFLFSYSAVQSLVQLQKLEIRNCKSIEEIINTEELRGEEKMIMMVFPKLSNLQLKGLPKLARFGSGNSVEFLSLTQISINDCPKLKTFFSGSKYADIKQSKEIEEMICQNDIHPLFDQKVVLPTLASINLSSIGIQTIWHNQLQPMSPCFQNLKEIIMDGCDTVKHGFPSSMVESLVQLEVLEISNCKLMEVVTITAGERMSNTLFTKLRRLHLKHLPELTTFCNFTGKLIELTYLAQLWLENCPKMHAFVSNSPRADMQPFFDEKVRILDLKLLYIEKMDNIRKIWCHQLTMDSFSKMDSFEVNYCHNLLNIFPSNMLGRLQKLAKLEVSDCKSVEVIFEELNTTEEDVETVPRFVFPQLTSLLLSDLPSIRSFYPTLICKVFRNLTSLKVLKCDNLKNLVPSFVSFQNLKKLEVSRCDGLVNLMEVSIAKSLGQLTRLKISECKMIEEIIMHGVDEVGNWMIFDQLEYLELHSLPKLTSFCSRNCNIEFPSLQQIVVRQCPTMDIFSQGVLSTPKLQRLQTAEVEDEGSWEGSLNTTIQKLFKDMVGFRGIEHFTVSDLLHFKEVWHEQNCVSNLKSLKSLVVDDNCYSLRYIFTPPMVLGLVQLQKLEIKNCDFLEVIVAIEEETVTNNMFPNLYELKLINLPELSSFCNFAGNAIELPSLTHLRIENCPNMQTFISNFTGEDMSTTKDKSLTYIQPLFDEKVGFPSLEKMVISSMDNLESIWHNQFLGDSFYKLKSVEVNDCQELKTIFPLCICGRLLWLESVTVKSCGSVIEIFDLRGINLKNKHSIQTTPQLRELYVDHMSNLKHIWNEDPKGMLSFEKLEKVTVLLCPNLENLFPTSVAKSLLNLDSLEVSDCGVEEIIAKEVGAKEAAADRFLFPQLSSLQLHNLPRLRTFYLGHTVEGPCLKRLGLHHCDKVTLFISEFLGFYETIEEGQLDISIHEQPPFFLVQEIEGTNQRFPYLDELQLSGKAMAMRWPSQVPGHVFCSLKSLELNDHESTVVPIDFIKRFGNLEKLSLNSSSYNKEIFSYGKDKEHPEIKHLVLSGLFDLKQIWKQGSKIDPNFQNLQIIEVRSCFKMINLMPSSASFRNLMILEVWGCDRLKNLLTSSTAKSLVLLEKLEVFDCKMLTEVIANEGAVCEEIVFGKLKTLSLVFLQSLASFCSAKHTLNFPILESLVVNECPKMKIFSKGVTSTSTSTPRLHKLELNWKAIEHSWEVGVNTTLQQNMERGLLGR